MSFTTSRAGSSNPDAEFFGLIRSNTTRSRIPHFRHIFNLKQYFQQRATNNVAIFRNIILSNPNLTEFELEHSALTALLFITQADTRLYTSGH